jgi:hypothetical protein
MLSPSTCRRRFASTGYKICKDIGLTVEEFLDQS